MSGWRKDDSLNETDAGGPPDPIEPNPEADPKPAPETASGPTGTASPVDEATARRQQRGESHVTGFAQAIKPTSPDEPPSPEAIESAASEHFEPSPEDQAKKKKVMIRSLWDAVADRGIVQKARATARGTLSQDYMWALYGQQKPVDEIEDVIEAFIIGDILCQQLKGVVTEEAFFEYFFEKGASHVAELRDVDGNTFAHLLLYLDVVPLPRLMDMVIAIGRALLRPDHEGAVSPDSARAVRAFLHDARNALGQSIAELVAEKGKTGSVRRALAFIAYVDALAAGETPSSGFEMVGGFDREAMITLLKAGDRDAATQMLVKDYERISPADVAAVLEATGEDLLALDLSEEIAGHTASLGLLNNAFAKFGLFSLDHAMRKLVKEQGRTMMGRRDARGYTGYMQLAAASRVNPAFVANENAFWGHVLRQVAIYRHRSRPDMTADDVVLRVARDVLDMPGDDGKTVLHLAAETGNLPVFDFVCDSVLDFRSTEELKRRINLGVSHADKLELQRIEAREIKSNLRYLLALDGESYTPLMRALEKGRTQIVQAMLARFERSPRYLEILCKLKVRPGGGLVEITLDRFASDVVDEGADPEAARLFRNQLRETRRRLEAASGGGF